MASTPDEMLLQNAIYVGINIQDILYGIELVLYFKTIHALLSRSSERTRTGLFYGIFSTVMLAITTIWVSVHAFFGQKSWIIDAKFPNSFSVVVSWEWSLDVTAVLIIVLQLMTDALMVYRCWIIWNNYYIVIIPSILWVGSLALGVLTGWSFTAYGGPYSSGLAAHFSLANYTVSVFLTAMLSFLICYRLLRHGKLVKDHLGREYASTYFAVTALVIESVLPYTLSGIAFLISIGIGSQMKTAFGYVYALMMCLSPQMLILRVATNTPVDNTSRRVPPSTVKFSPQENPASGAVSKVSIGFEMQRLQTPGSSQHSNADMV